MRYSPSDEDFNDWKGLKNLFFFLSVQPLHCPVLGCPVLLPLKQRCATCCECVGVSVCASRFDMGRSGYMRLFGVAMCFVKEAKEDK